MSDTNRPARTAGKRKASKVAEGAKTFPIPEVSDEEQPPAEPSDPALVAARAMIERALRTARLMMDEAAREGTVTAVVLPSVDWVRPALAFWRHAARNGRHENERYGDRFSWAAWAPSEAPGKHRAMTDNEEFGSAIARGRHCVGFASDPSWLPSDLLLAADVRFEVAFLDAAGLAEVVRTLCGSPGPELLTDGQAAGLTPRLLRLARRVGQTAEAYTAKLAEMLGLGHGAPEAVRPAVVSPRGQPTLGRLHGMDAAVAWGMDLARDLAAYRDGALPWSAVDCGCLLSGPPGCGKTLFARALAATCGVPLVAGAYGQWLGTGDGHMGTMLRAMRKSFADAKAAAPSILFVDEIDSFPDRAKTNYRNGEWDIQVVNAFLAEIDGVTGRGGVVLLGACNHPDRLDPALVRSGRLDRHIRIGLPGRRAFAAILREHLGDGLAGEDLGQAALLAMGMTGADAERVVREARRTARTAGREVVLQDLVQAIGGNDGRSGDDLDRAAVHEAGHANAAAELGLDIGGVSLRGSAGSGGQVSVMQRSRFLSAADMHDLLVLVLSGRAAEETILHVPTTGAGGNACSDLAVATEIAARAASEMGFDGARGLVWLGVPDQAPDLRRMLQSEPSLAAAVRSRLADAYGDALAIAERRADRIRRLADVLLARRAMDPAEVAVVLGTGDSGAGDIPRICPPAREAER